MSSFNNNQTKKQTKYMIILRQFDLNTMMNKFLTSNNKRALFFNFESLQVKLILRNRKWRMKTENVMAKQSQPY